MNPLTWKREHQVALLLALVIGAAIGVVVGYLVYASGTSSGMRFSYWVWNRYGAQFDPRPEPKPIWWSLFGAGIGAGIVYVRRLMSN